MADRMFTISDVADLLSIRRLRGGTADMFNVVCPFCGDTRGKCNFCVSRDGEIKNVYHCFHCGAAGNMLTLYADLTGIYGSERYKEAYWQIRDYMDSGERREPQEYRIREKKRKAAVPVDKIRRHRVYLALIGLLSLKEKHKNDLRKRGLSEAEIIRMEEKGYRSTAASESQAVARKLIKQGFRLEGVPGFFLNKRGDWEIAFYQKNAGYLCPVWTEEGLLAAFQIRLDHPYKKRKYVWLTSTNMEKGCSGGSPAGISGNPHAESIYVTEGILKAEIAYQHTGKTFLGNPGVMNHKELKQILTCLKKQGLKNVYECYDMDKLMSLECRMDYDSSCGGCLENEGKKECPRKRRKRDNIQNGCVKLYRICEELSLSCRRIVWDRGTDGLWMEHYKGIDDWMMDLTDRKRQKMGKE